MRYSPCLLTLLFPVVGHAFFCPTNFNQIDFGMTPDQVVQACGAPEKQAESVKENENIPQEWSYFIPQTVSLRGSTENAEGTLKTTITFDDKGRAINISVNGIGVGASTICGPSIQLGDSREAVKTACGSPSFVNKQTPAPDSPAAQSVKIIEFNYLSATPPATLIFEDGKLADKK